MKRSFFSAVLAAALFAVSTSFLQAQETTPAPTNPPAATPPPAGSTPNVEPAPAAELTPQTELQALVAKIMDKLRQGQRTEEALADDIKGFDALLTKYKDQKTDDVAEILVMKGMLYVQVFSNLEKGLPMLQQVKTDFPATKAAAQVDMVIERIQKQQVVEKTKTELVGKPAPALTFSWTNRGDLKDLASLKGKVVVLDFWATWCGPCVSSFPQIKELTDRYKDYNVEVIGVTSLQGRIHGLEPQPIDCRGEPEKEKSLMSDYIKAKEINWTIAFSEQEVFNPDYGVAGIPHMTIVAPDGTVRHNGIHPGSMTLGQKAEMIDALLKEAGLKTPPAI